MVRNILRALSVLLVVALLMSFTAVPAFAFDARSGNQVVVGSGEVVDSDLYIVGGDIVIDGTVNGDIFAAGRSLTINGTVNGAVTLAGQMVTVNGTVARSARLAGQNVNVIGNIKGDAVLAGSAVFISNSAKIGGDLVTGASSLDVSGSVDGGFKGGAGTVSISGTIAKDVNIDTGSLTLAPSAIIKSSLTYTSENEATVQSGSRIEGKTTHNIPVPKEAKKKGPVAEIPGKLLGFIMAFVVGLIIIVVARRRITNMANSIVSKPWHCLGWGALILFATPIACIIVCITLIGLPVGLIALALYGIAIYLSQVPVALCIGRLILGRFREVNSLPILIAALAIGLFILMLLSWIPVLGFIIGLAVAIFGLGSLLVSEMKLRQ